MLIWVDGFLGVVCWGGAIGSRQMGARLMMIVLDCVVRTILVVVVSGGLCAVWSFDSESGLLMIVGEWPFPGFAGHVGLVMARPVAHDSGIVPSCRVVRGVVPRIAVESRLNNGRIAVELIWLAIRVMRWSD